MIAEYLTRQGIKGLLEQLPPVSCTDDDLHRYWLRVQYAFFSYGGRHGKSGVRRNELNSHAFGNALKRLKRCLPKEGTDLFATICWRGKEFRYNVPAGEPEPLYPPESEKLHELISCVDEISRWLSPERQSNSTRPSETAPLSEAVRLIGDDLPAAYEDILAKKFGLSVDGPGVRFVEGTLRLARIKTRAGKDYPRETILKYRQRCLARGLSQRNKLPWYDRGSAVSTPS
jgi:hypothetical protein